MDERTNSQPLKNLTDEALTSIKERVARRNKDYPDGEGFEYWTDTFELCKSVPSLLAELDQLTAKVLELQNENERLRCISGIT
jgi:hypothetical protein